MKLLISFFLFAFAFLPISASEKTSFNRKRSFDVQHYVIRLSFNRSKKIVYGDSTVILKPLSDGFALLELDSRKIKFESIKLVGTNRELKYRTSNDKVLISLDKSYKKAN